MRTPSKMCALVLGVLVLCGCGSREEAKRKVVGNQWHKLCKTKGCLKGAHLWSKDRLNSESVFLDPNWQSFLRRSPSDTVPFLMERIHSTKNTKVHVCPWENAQEGALAVYATQQVLKMNWHECKTDSKHLKKYIRKTNRDQVNTMPFLLSDTLAAEELERCFLQVLEKKHGF